MVKNNVKLSYSDIAQKYHTCDTDNCIVEVYIEFHGSHTRVHDKGYIVSPKGDAQLDRSSVREVEEDSEVEKTRSTSTRAWWNHGLSATA